ncbi:MAG: SUMF1/EgtB/PvdO family nonheme iron enzyme [Opitutae bacterium]|nr:SUMF1/EgtB/PvdO family nonheme iron enzyme [Opitutae bacterium]
MSHEASVKTVCIDMYEVKYESVMGENPSHFTGVSIRPVENVSWHQAKEYCQRLGKRLPTEWEWENAVRSKKSTAYFWGNEFNPDFAWFINNIGLFDMIENVWEWTDSGENNLKYLRGGSWNTYEKNMRTNDRRQSDPSFTSSTFGFRCAQ